MQVNINSETGELQGVIIHTPGKEIEAMTPDNITAALYSDLLNLNIARKEYLGFNEVLKRWCKTFEVKDLLTQVLSDEDAKKDLVTKVIFAEHKLLLFEPLMNMSADKLALALNEGLTYDDVKFVKPSINERYVLLPLYNLFFTRDAASVIFNGVLVNSMKSPVRQRESLIMESIFHHFNIPLINPQSYSKEATTEGGDILIANNNTLFVGCGSRTNEKGIEALANYFAARKQPFNIVVQHLPQSPESFIHLDMVFTLLGNGKCMVYEPLILNDNAFATFHIEINGGKITYNEKRNFLEATKAAGIELEPVLCGGADKWNQQREQWHSGANFFALGEGKVIGYARNNHTIEALNKAGFDVLYATDVIDGKVDMKQHTQFVVTFDAAELPRGGGGARCMTMPINRTDV
ncbi:MAG: arginine deiminase [Bacteroidales bacterium]|jgi:arginine deiminase|nr:arginine deiminase [Bacteroidales bacterium]